MDGVGEDFDEEVGVNQGLERGRVVPGKIYNLAMADLDVSLEITKKYFYKLTSGAAAAVVVVDSLFIKYIKRLSFYIMVHPTSNI